MADALSAPEVETPDVSDSPFCRAMGLIAGGLAAVSYTHLDVYKRQVLSTPPAFVLSQDQTLNKMVSKELSLFKSSY